MTPKEASHVHPKHGPLTGAVLNLAGRRGGRRWRHERLVELKLKLFFAAVAMCFTPHARDNVPGRHT